MPFYRVDLGPERSGWAHINIRRALRPCVGPALEFDDAAQFGGKCGRISIALCDAPAGEDLAGKPVTCDAPLCEHHRTRGGTNVDYCPRHKHLAPAELPL